MKICSQCNIEKSIADYYSKTSTKTHSWCKQCFNKMSIEKWRQRKLDAIQLLGGKCIDCNGVFHPNVYDFHHLKDKDVGWGKLRLRSWKRIQDELSKCVLLCANCHRIRHIR